MLCLPKWFGKGEIVAAVRGYEKCSFTSLRGASATKQSIFPARRCGLLRGACHRARIRATRWLSMTGERPLLASRPEFQALESGGDVDADLALQAERLQRDRIVGAA